MYSRFLFIGLGGSGGKTLRFLKREMRRWMEKHEQPDKIPDAWQFLHIDTQPQPDGQEIDNLAPQLAANEYLGLTTSGMTFTSIQNQLDAESQRGGWMEDLATWRVDPTSLYVPLNQGAGQYRAIGNTLGMASIPRIKSKLEQSANTCQTGKANAELIELFANITGSTPGGVKAQEPAVIVISSLAGGTGSGLVNIVCDVLRSVLSVAGDHVFALLYTPETFRELKLARGIQANSLAAISEILNGHWWGGSVTRNDSYVNPIHDGCLQSAGCTKLLSRSGPAFPFLVGAKNAHGVGHGTFDQLYETVGRSLLSWVTDMSVYSKFISYTTGNWAQAASSNTMGHVLVNAGDHQEVGYPPFSALGFSRLSVGVEHFERYMVGHFQQDAWRHLVNYHVDSEEALRAIKRQGRNVPEDIINELATPYLPRFLHKAQLSEFGPDENQIVDALRPDTMAKIATEFKANVTEVAGLSRTDYQSTAEEWIDQINQTVEECFATHHRKFEDDLEESTEDWINKVQGSVIGAAEEAVVNFGLKVASSLCRQTVAYLSDQVYDDIVQRDLPQYMDWSRQGNTWAAEDLGEITGRVSGGDERLDRYASECVRYRMYELEAVLARRAADMSQKTARRLLSPLAQALEEAWMQASEEAEQAAQSAHVALPRGEFTLLSPDEFPALLRNLLSDTFGDAGGASQPQRQARDAIIGSQSGGDSLIDVDQSWWPEMTSPRRLTEVARSAAVNIATDIEALGRRARSWVRTPGTTIGRFLGLCFRQCLSDPDPSTSAHAVVSVSRVAEFKKRFLAQIGTAIEASAPLIDLDRTLLGTVHPNPQQHDLHFSAIPLENLPIAYEVKSALQSAGQDPHRADDWFTTDEGVTTIDITSAFSAPMSVLAMKSLLKPIADDWSQAAPGSDDEREFWKQRRSRPLHRFVPCSQALLACMVRGWFVGRLLGMIDTSERPRIMCVDMGAAFDFPRPFPTRSSDPLEHLALVLESLPLAYVEASRLSSLDPFKPYIQLRELGRSVGSQRLWDYDDLSAELADWVSSGVFAHRICEPLIRDVDPDSVPVGRARRLLEILERAVEQHTNRFEKYRSEWGQHPSRLSKAPLWTGCWPLISRSLAQIRDAADRRCQTGDGGIEDLLH